MQVHTIDSFNSKKLRHLNIENFSTALLQGLNRFLEYLQEKIPDLVEKYIQELILACSKSGQQVKAVEYLNLNPVIKDLMPR